MKRECRYCNHCKQLGRQQRQQNRDGRKRYYCKNPKIKGLKDKHGLPLQGFIGFGSMEPDSPLVLKTHPRWCPMESQTDKV